MLKQDLTNVFLLLAALLTISDFNGCTPVSKTYTISYDSVSIQTNNTSLIRITKPEKSQLDYCVRDEYSFRGQFGGNGESTIAWHCESGYVVLIPSIHGRSVVGMCLCIPTEAIIFKAEPGKVYEFDLRIKEDKRGILVSRDTTLKIYYEEIIKANPYKKLIGLGGDETGRLSDAWADTLAYLRISSGLVKNKEIKFYAFDITQQIFGKPFSSDSCLVKNANDYASLKIDYYYYAYPAHFKEISGYLTGIFAEKFCKDDKGKTILKKYYIRAIARDNKLYEPGEE